MLSIIHIGLLSGFMMVVTQIMTILYMYRRTELSEYSTQNFFIFHVFLIVASLNRRKSCRKV